MTDSKKLADGEYSAKVTLSGGTGKATIDSPAKLVVKNGKISATIIWSSKNYDYMLVDGEKYLNEAKDGDNSTFTIPVPEIGKEFDVIGDTVAMSKPHEIEYTLCLEVE